MVNDFKKASELLYFLVAEITKIEFCYLESAAISLQAMEEKKVTEIFIRLPVTEKAKIQAAAKAAGLSVSVWSRLKLLAAAK